MRYAGMVVIAAMSVLMTVEAQAGATMHGPASWYGREFAGRPTSTGEKFDPQALTAAHKTLPLGSIVRVVCHHRAVIVRINDRGPYSGARIIDLSERAATALNMREKGVDEVTLILIRQPSIGIKQRTRQ